MQTYPASILLLCAGVAACAATADDATVPATATWGAGLSIAAPASIVFNPAAYSPAWKFRGAAGGARIDGGARAFTIDLAASNGENVAEGALRFDGRASFAMADDGALAVEWTVVPDRDAELPEVMIESRIPLGRVPDGFRVDGRDIPIEASVPQNPHLFRGAVSRVEPLGADGEPWLRVDLPDTAEILVQDNRAWGGSVATLRLFFARKSVEAGRPYSVRARFSVPGRAIGLDESGPVVLAAGSDWIPAAIPAPGEDWVEPGSALDFSATMPHHEPAGAFGRVVAVGDHFELEGRPGEEIRFCGVNLVHGANTPSTPEDAERFAANLARMGFNSVRLHHHERPIFKRGDPAALELDPEAMDRFDALCAACIRHGLYITTDLFVSREPIAWRAVGIDRDGTFKKDVFKRLVIFHEGAYSNLVAWTRLFLGRKNPYTGRSLAEEPGLATLALVNEGNLGNWGRDSLLETPGVAEAWQAWREKRGLKGAGTDGIPADLYEGKGENKALANEFALFLADAEERFYHRLAALVRDELGCRAPLSSLSSWYNPAAYSLARAAFDYDDDHGYVDHPRFLGNSWKLPSTHQGDNPLLGGDGVPSLAWRRLFGKPFCVTEWNWAAPGEFRAASGLVMGALAARQGWSGLWRFAWSHQREGVDAPGSVRMRYFDLHADPALWASERATLCLFLRGDMPSLPADCASPIETDEAALRRGEGAASRMNVPVNAPSAWERRIGIRLGEFASSQVREFASSDVQKFAGSQVRKSEVQSPKSEVQNSGQGADGSSAVPEPSRGAFWVDSPCTAGGFTPSGSLSAGPLRFTLVPTNDGGTPPGPPAPAAAAVWASSLDGKPIADSSRILLSHVTDAKNTGAGFDDPSCRIWIEYGTTPALVRCGAAEIELTLDGSISRGAAENAENKGNLTAEGPFQGGEAADLNGKAVTVWRLSPTGHRIAEVPSTFAPATGTLRFTARTDYDPGAATTCYEITR